MLNVLFTVDTETFPITKNWKLDGLAADMKRDLHGEIDGRAVGLEYQLDTFARHGLKAVFMVESMFAAVPEVGPAPLKRIVRTIQDGGHDIQVHCHPEWVQHIPTLGIPFRGHLLRSYTVGEQEKMIRFAKERLEDAGAPNPNAFRAGGFAANQDTFVALSRVGIHYDTSYNRCYQDDGSQLPEPECYGHAIERCGVEELPVAVFRDRPFHFRPAQVHACSSAEMLHALDAAERNGWEFFVIVAHSFEMISCRRHATKAPRIREAVVERFETLCRYLSANRQRFATVGFGDLPRSRELHASNGNGNGNHSKKPALGIKGNLFYTAGRLLEQGINRIRTY